MSLATAKKTYTRHPRQKSRSSFEKIHAKCHLEYWYRSKLDT